jgi:tRNA A-37 threonylcarbamoyl transferase component Bud32
VLEVWRVGRAIFERLMLKRKIGLNATITVKEDTVEKTYATPYSKKLSEYEYETLKLLHALGIRVPEPISYDKNEPRLIMKKIDGITLFEYFYVATNAEIIATLRNYANDLCALHRIPFYHFDLNTKNVLVDKKGNVSMIDWQVKYETQSPPDCVDVAFAYMSIRQSFGMRDLFSIKGAAMARIFLDAYMKGRKMRDGQHAEMLRCIKLCAKKYLKICGSEASKNVLAAGYFFIKHLELWFFIRKTRFGLVK